MKKLHKKSPYDRPLVANMEVMAERGFELSSADSQLEDMFESEGSWD